MKNEYEDVQVLIKRRTKNDKIHANATVILKTTVFGALTIKGFTIWKSNHLHPQFQEHINITPPTIRTYGRFTPYVFFEDRKCWNRIEELIYEAYRSSEQGTDMNEDIDPKTVPF